MKGWLNSLLVYASYVCGYAVASLADSPWWAWVPVVVFATALVFLGKRMAS